MKVICVDDETLVLDYMNKLLQKVDGIEDIKLFNQPNEAIVYVSENTVDIAFLDIKMYDENGIEVAKKMKTVAPNTNIIFVTSYSDYAVEAFKVRASGYLLKPVMLEDLIEEIGNIHNKPQDLDKRIKIQTFGNFEIFVDGKPLQFSRSKSKELIAYLVDKRGTSVNSSELIVNLWEDKDVNSSSRSMLHNLLADIKKTLASKKIDESCLIIKGFNSFQLNTEEVDCDYFRFLNGDVAVINSFTGEYMNNYEWALFTAAYIQNKLEK